MRILVASVLLLAACYKTNENYCPGLQDNHCRNLDAAPQRCDRSTADCLCLLPQGICVDCIAGQNEDKCVADKPVCGPDHTCHECRADNECDSNACLETGACANQGDVLYVVLNGSADADCGTVTKPCSLGQAMLLVSMDMTTKNIIRLAPGTYPFTSADGLDVTKNLTVVARMSTFRRTGGTGPLVTVRTGNTFKLIGATLLGPTGSDGIRCDNANLRVHEAVIDGMQESAMEGNSCDLTVARSTLRNNLRGGVHMIGDSKVATITNNFVYNNGANTSTIGGMVLKLVGGSRVEFNTVVDNTVASSGGAGGILCDGSYDAKYNLIFRNEGGIGDMVQVLGTCTFMGSYSQAAPSGDNAVGFKDPNNLTTPDFHLTDQSPVGTIRDAFDCEDVDFDLDPRPINLADAKCDYGADEYRPVR